MLIMLPERFTYSLVLGDECASAFQKIIEVENGCGAFEGRVISEHLVKLIG
jgi:hypothetical protein